MKTFKLLMITRTDSSARPICANNLEWQSVDYPEFLSDEIIMNSYLNVKTVYELCSVRAGGMYRKLQEFIHNVLKSFVMYLRSLKLHF